MKNDIIRFVFLILFFVCNVYLCISQSLSLNELEQFQGSGLQEIRLSLNNYGWEFSSSKEQMESEYYDFGFLYDKVEWTLNNDERFTLLTKEGNENILIITMSLDSIISLENKVKLEVKPAGFKVLNNQIISYYKSDEGLDYLFVEYKDNTKHEAINTFILAKFESNEDKNALLSALYEINKLYGIPVDISPVDVSPVEISPISNENDEFGKGSGGIGTGIYDGTGDGIFGRQPVSGRIPASLFKRRLKGKISMKVCINRSGKVTYVSILQSETTIQDRSQQDIALDAMSKYLWEEDYSAAKEQCGKYMFDFRN